MHYKRYSIDLSAIPDDVLKSEWARRTQAKRTTRSGGRPTIETPCPRCGVMQPSARAARAHCKQGSDG